MPRYTVIYEHHKVAVEILMTDDLAYAQRFMAEESKRPDRCNIQIIDAENPVAAVPDCGYVDATPTGHKKRGPVRRKMSRAQRSAS